MLRPYRLSAVVWHGERTGANCPMICASVYSAPTSCRLCGAFPAPGYSPRSAKPG